MIKYFCDGCKREITSGIWRVSIYADAPKFAANDYWDVAMATASSTNNIKKSFEGQPMYCGKCIDKIKSFIACGF